MPLKVFVVAHIPEALQKAWLQHLRDFDTANHGCHFEIMADAPDQSLAEIVEMLRVEPALSFTTVLDRRGRPR